VVAYNYRSNVRLYPTERTERTALGNIDPVTLHHDKVDWIT